METIGQKILQLRKQKAYSQEQLADLSNVNVRTIQRIENNETSPRGATLKLLCDALEITPNEIINYDKVSDKSLIIWLHLSVIVSLVLPLGNIIIPLILWLTNKNKIEDVDYQGKNILNFQILYSISSFIFMFLIVFGKLTSFSINLNIGILILILFILYLLNIIYPIINAIRINNGTMTMFYPTIFRFIR